MSETIGKAVYCAVCQRRKKPVGRDAASAGPDLCDQECPGYYQEPHPGYLWPGEPEDDL